jgi:hypothetical protein
MSHEGQPWILCGSGDDERGTLIYGNFMGLVNGVFEYIKTHIFSEK